MGEGMTRMSRCDPLGPSLLSLTWWVSIADVMTATGHWQMHSKGGEERKGHTQGLLSLISA